MAQATHNRATQPAPWLLVLLLGAGALSMESLTEAGTPIEGPGIANHPVGVVPSAGVRVPTDWPLDSMGAITCFTCHTEIPAEPTGANPKLRGVNTAAEPGTAFCGTCHEFDQRDAKSIHWLALGTAHVQSDRGATRVNTETLGAQTRRCLSCHDGAMASESGNATPWNHFRGGMGDEGRNHPVGIRYERSNRLRRASPLRPASLLPEEVRLPDGKVSCVSCHNLYAGSPYLLAVPTRGSQLCLTCHDMS